MGNKKNWAMDFFPPMPDWGWDNDEQKEKWEEFKSNVGKLWDQYQDMQKAAEKAWKEQWETFFAQFLDMQQTVADTLPDEKAAVPGMPSAPVSPKEFVEKAKELQEKANAHVVERADAMVKYRRQRRQQVKEMVADAVQNVEDNLDAVESSKDDEPAEK